METRIGFGWDSHAFKAGIPLRIGGMTLDHPEGLAGHSDGDVLLHAITDALLGAVAAGRYWKLLSSGRPALERRQLCDFPQPGDWKSCNTRDSDRECRYYAGAERSEDRAGRRGDAFPSGGSAGHRDGPGEHQGQNSGGPWTGPCGPVPRCRSVERTAEAEELKSMTAVIESQRQLEDVVEDLLSQVHGVPKKRTITPVYDTEDIT